MSPTITIPVDDSIHLSPLQVSDRTRCVELLNNRDIYEWTLRVPHPYSGGHFDDFLQIVAEGELKHGHPIHFAIRGPSGTMMGGVGFEGLSHGHRAEIGYWLGTKYWGRGIMTEVVRAATAFAQREWQLARIMAHVFDGNTASSRVLKKNGFRFEGLLTNHFRKEGRLINARLYALVK